MRLLITGKISFSRYKESACSASSFLTLSDALPRADELFPYDHYLREVCRLPAGPCWMREFHVRLYGAGLFILTCMRAVDFPDLVLIEHEAPRL